jgi:hypothetical protein
LQIEDCRLRIFRTTASVQVQDMGNTSGSGHG